MMRLASIRAAGVDTAALITEGGACPIRELSGRENANDVRALIDRPLSPSEYRRLATSALPLEDIEWLPPLTPPKNVFCVGKNYFEHVKEGAKAEGRSSFEVPLSPVWFTKPHTSLLGHLQNIIADRTFTEALDYEGELVAVIGAPTHRVRRDQVFGRLFGYTILNDVTARDLQQQRNQWFTGKSADTYAPCGPWIVTTDDIPDPQDLAIRTRVSDRLRQEGATDAMIFDIPSLIADLSQGITLEPGDMVATGTPHGVAWGMDAPRYLRPGDHVAVEVESIGRLANSVTARP